MMENHKIKVGPAYQAVEVQHQANQGDWFSADKVLQEMIWKLKISKYSDFSHDLDNNFTKTGKI